MMQTFSKTIETLTANGYTIAGTGSKRAAYLSPCKKHVIKVPINHIGIMENYLEHRKYSDSCLVSRSKLAKCMLAKNLIIMEYITPTSETLPMWCDEFDNQVGYNSKGALVAYDYGG